MKKGKNKQLQKAEKKETSIVRSSAAEYLTFVAATGKGGVEAVYADENIWLSQKMMGVLYDVNVRTVNEHLKKIFADPALGAHPVIGQVIKSRTRLNAVFRVTDLGIIDITTGCAFPFFHSLSLLLNLVF